jgi:hypothetical protein
MTDREDSTPAGSGTKDDPGFAMGAKAITLFGGKAVAHRNGDDAV